MEVLVPDNAGGQSPSQPHMRQPLPEVRVSVQYLQQAFASHDTAKLIRYVRLHLGDGDDAVGRKEIDKAWVEALRLLVDVPTTDRAFILDTLTTKDPATLAHLFFHLHFYLVQRSGEWIHGGLL